MNIKSAALRVTNKKLKAELKECKRVISLKDNANLSLTARKDTYINLVSHLEDTIENQKNEAKHLEKENIERLRNYYDLVENNLSMERELEVFERKLSASEAEITKVKDLIKRFEEKADKLSTRVAELIKENEYFMSKSIASKIKNIFKKR